MFAPAEVTPCIFYQPRLLEPNLLAYHLSPFLETLQLPALRTAPLIAGPFFSLVNPNCCPSFLLVSTSLLVHRPPSLPFSSCTHLPAYVGHPWSVPIGPGHLACVTARLLHPLLRRGILSARGHGYTAASLACSAP